MTIGSLGYLGLRVKDPAAFHNFLTSVLGLMPGEAAGRYRLDDLDWRIAVETGDADDLARAKNVSVDGLVRAGIVRSGAGKVRLLDRNELDSSWDPSSDKRVTVWEVCQHLIRRLDQGAESAGELLGQVGGLGEAARDLAYRLFQVAESKRWAREAGPYTTTLLKRTCDSVWNRSEWALKSVLRGRYDRE